MNTPTQHAVARVVVDLPVPGPFDYAVAPDQQGRIAVGSRVQVPFHYRKLVGCVVGLRDHSEFAELKTVLKVLDERPALSAGLLRVTRRFADYYGCSWGEAIAAALPASLRRSGTYPPKNKDWTLPDQLSESDPPPAGIVLSYDRGADKTWADLSVRIKAALDQRRDVIILFPEAAMINDARRALKKIGLTDEVIVLDKKLSPARELAAWHAARLRPGAIVIGTRSAVFAPARSPGLYIIFEEDHPAYKQEQVPCYHVREAVLMRQQIEGGDAVFVGAAPSAELLVKAGGLSVLPPPVKDDYAPLQPIDLANYKPKHASALSFPLQTQVREILEQGGRVVLLYNRRGFSTLIRCNQCGHSLRCDRCNVSLTYLADRKKLNCHSCHGEWPLPDTCPQCRGHYLRHLGGGVERLEADMRKYYPGVPVARCDADHDKVASSARLIVATQAVVRSLAGLRPDLIAVLDMDAELNRYDFRSANRALSHLLKLRTVGKKVLVQTYHRDHYVIKAAQSLELAKFYEEELALRQDLQFPPFCHLVAVVARGPLQDAVQAVAAALFTRLQDGCPDGIEVMDPQPDHQAKLRDQFRLTILLKGQDLPSVLGHIHAVQSRTRKKKDVIVTLNVDP